jgi:hypothetical protein
MKNRFIYFFILISFVTINQSFAQSESKAAPEISVPIQIMASAGDRPFISTSVNGKPVMFQLHSSAALYMQISHKLADTAKVANRHHVGSYGIVKIGQVSSLGLDTAFVDELTIGGHVFNHVPASIFETPSPYDQGMLGLRWLAANRAIINYQKKIVVLNATNGGKAIHDQLLQENYIAIPMKRNNAAAGRYYVSVKVNDIVEPMIVSTVSHNIFDIDFAKRSSVEYKAAGGENYGGPTGTEGKVYVNTKPIAIQIGDASFELPVVHFLDTYAYEGISRPKNPSDITGGMLGCDFLLAHGAVVDFGNGILYLKKTE